MDIKKYAYIDALRGWAVLGVLADHSALAVRPESDALNSLMVSGAKGVELFFMISALTLCMSWNARSSIEKFPKLDFYLRRFFRIAPMFYLAIILYLFLFGFTASYAAPYGVKNWFVLSTAFFLHGWHPETINSIVPGDWTIAAEVMFYAMFPFLVTRFRSIASLIGLLLGSLVLVKINGELIKLVFRYPENLHYMVSDFAFKNILSQLPVFVLGMFVYTFIKDKARMNSLAWVGLTLCFIASRIFMPWFTFWGIGLSVAIIYLSSHPIRPIVNPVTAYLGKLSFSMYLLQFAFLYLFNVWGITNILLNSRFGSLIHMVLLTAVTTVAATVSFEVIETPGIRLGKLIIERINRRFAEPCSAPQ